MHMHLHLLWNKISSVPCGLETVYLAGHEHLMRIWDVVDMPMNLHSLERELFNALYLSMFVFEES
jgi:hypothetical protein